MNLLVKTLKISTALLALMFSLPYAANAEQSEAAYQPSIENVRDPNQYCAKCHTFSKQQFHGTHLTKTNPSTGKPITCVSCHGNISENHRRGVKDVMRFHGDIFSQEKSLFTTQEQNQVCFSCHQPEKLREKFWAHDVHAMKLPCASCHTLHPKQDAMQGIEPKARVKLCVDCHGEQQKRQAEQSQKEKDKP